MSEVSTSMFNYSLELGWTSIGENLNIALNLEKA